MILIQNDKKMASNLIYITDIDLQCRKRRSILHHAFSFKLLLFSNELDLMIDKFMKDS